jgi:hypothetical protein
MIINGIVNLCDQEGTIITCKKYNSKKNRNQIIETWGSLYALDKKSITINVSPNLDEYSAVGVVEIYFKNKFCERRGYYSKDERDDIIDSWKKTYKNFYIHIKPTQ